MPEKALSKREEAKAAAQELLKACEEAFVRVPTDPQNARIEAGTILNSTKVDGNIDQKAALKEMIEKFGIDEKKKKVSSSSVKDEKENEATSPKKRKRKSKTSADDQEEDAATSPKKARKKPEATNPKNQELVDVLADLVGFEFKNEQKFKAIALSKATKALRDYEDEITSGKQAMKLKGVGKSTAQKIDQFLESGKIDRLEEYLAGNL